MTSNSLYALICSIKNGIYHQNYKISLNILINMYKSEYNIKTQKEYTFLNILLKEGYIYKYKYNLLTYSNKLIYLNNIVEPKLKVKKQNLNNYFIKAFASNTHSLYKFSNFIIFKNFNLINQNFNNTLNTLFRLRKNIKQPHWKEIRALRKRKGYRRLYDPSKPLSRYNRYYPYNIAIGKVSKRLEFTNYLDKFQYRKKKLNFQTSNKYHAPLSSQNYRYKTLSFLGVPKKLNKTKSKFNLFISKIYTNMLYTYRLTVYFRKSLANNNIINNIRVISKPGHKIYIKNYNLKKTIKHQLNYFNKLHLSQSKKEYGLIILNTSKGLVSHIEAQKRNIGGEVLCIIK
jgi:ribosomal protein S8